MGNAVYKLLTDQARISPDLAPQTSSDFYPDLSPISGLGESGTPGCHEESGTRSQTQHPSQPREPVHRPHSPKTPPSPFSTVDLDESEGELPLIPKRLRKRTVPKIVESAFGRNEQNGPFRSSQIRADSPPESEFELLVERRAARKAGASKDPEARSIGDDTTWEGVRDHEPGPSTPSTWNDPILTESQIRSPFT